MKKIKFYKGLLIEIIETLCSICLYLEQDGRRNHNMYSNYMRDHSKLLKEYSEILRCGKSAESPIHDRPSHYMY